MNFSSLKAPAVREHGSRGRSFGPDRNAAAGALSEGTGSQQIHAEAGRFRGRMCVAGKVAADIEPRARRQYAGNRILSVAEVAELLDVPEVRVERALNLAPPSFFPHAWQEAGTWFIPERDARRLLGPALEPLFSIPAFAELVGFSHWHIRTEVAAGRIKSEVVLGRRRIPAAEYWRLRGKR